MWSRCVFPLISPRFVSSASIYCKKKSVFFLFYSTLKSISGGTRAIKWVISRSITTGPEPTYTSNCCNDQNKAKASFSINWWTGLLIPNGSSCSSTRPAVTWQPLTCSFKDSPVVGAARAGASQRTANTPSKAFSGEQIYFTLLFRKTVSSGTTFLQKSLPNIYNKPEKRHLPYIHKIGYGIMQQEDKLLLKIGLCLSSPIIELLFEENWFLSFSS